MRIARYWTTATLGFAMLTSACVDEGDARDGARIEPYTDHDEPLDFEPVEGKTDGVSEVFNQNLVVTDEFFTASNAVTPAQIQAFLEHTPYNKRSFLADETVNGRKFSEVLVEVAQSRQLNPIMLLSRMQVEKSLIAKTSRPSGNAVDFAFGCGCPDNQPCNEAYRGIDKQVDCAAKTLRTHYDGSVAGTGQWRKGKTKNTLDPIAITPQGHATASLYAYTPWVLTGSGGNWLVWNITRRYANALAVSVPSGPQPGFVGSPCTEELESLPQDEQARYATCEFSASGETGFCYPFTTPAGDDLGVCSLMCAGYCPDQGSTTTFCAELEAGAGFCVLKAGTNNHDCADIPGTVVQEVDRFVGSSGAPATTARVCMPDAKAGETEPPPSEDPPSEDPPATGGSCEGACGSSDPVANGDGTNCYCDAGCAEYGDCCGDYETACG